MRCAIASAACCGAGLDHHPDQLLGAGRTQQDPPVVAELAPASATACCDLRRRGDRVLVGDCARSPAPAAAVAPRGELGQRLPVSTIRAMTCSAVSSPSPVVAESVNTTCPLCSPPRLNPLVAQGFEHVTVTDRGGDDRDPGGAHRVVEAEIAHHRGDDGVAWQQRPPSAARSHTSPRIWSPSTTSPAASTARHRSASPSWAMPRSAPSASTALRS